jgi:hypothetical protein
MCFIDAGYGTSDVYAVARKNAARSHACYGRPQIGKPVMHSIVDTDKRTGKSIPAGQINYSVHDGYFKAFVFSKLSLNKAEHGAWLFHAKPEEGYLRTICNVVPIRELDTRGREKTVWRVLDEEWGEHFNDCEVYCAAAAYLMECLDLKEPGKPTPRQLPPRREPRIKIRRGRGIRRRR